MFLNRIMNTVPLGSPVKFTPHLCSAIKILPFNFIPLLLHTLLCQYCQAPTIRFITIHQFLIIIANISSEKWLQKKGKPFQWNKILNIFWKFHWFTVGVMVLVCCRYGTWSSDCTGMTSDWSFCSVWNQTSEAFSLPNHWCFVSRFNQMSLLFCAWT